METDPQGAELGTGARHIGQAEVLGRRINEAIERDAPGDSRLTVLCECGMVGCTTKLTIPHAHYERARAHFDLFLVAPGHDIAAVEAVVARHADYVLVRKQGEAARVAEADAVDADAR